MLSERESSLSLLTMDFTEIQRLLQIIDGKRAFYGFLLVPNPK
jgi:hypothetical protein